MLVQNLADTTTTKNIAAARFAAGAVDAYDIRERTHALPIRTAVIWLAPESTKTAVVGVVADIRLAAISWETVTIGKARVAGRDETVSIRTDASSVRQITDVPAEPAVVGIGLQVRLTPICRIAIAVREAGIADSRTHAI